MFGKELSFKSERKNTPIILITDEDDPSLFWEPNIEGLSANYQLIVPDRLIPSAGAQDIGGYSVDRLADDVISMMDRFGIESAHLVGHALGGAIGQTIAIDHPGRLKSLVLYATWSRPTPHMLRMNEARRQLVLQAGVEAYRRAEPAFLYPAWWINANSRHLEARDMLSGAHLPSREAVALRLEASSRFDRSWQLHQIKTPTLVLCARDDVLTPCINAEALANAIPNAELLLPDTGGHAYSEVFPSAFNRAVLEFMARRSEERWRLHAHAVGTC